MPDLKTPLLTAGLALALAAAPAGAAVDSLVAAGPDGTAHFAWTANGAPGLVEERTLAAGGAFGDTQFVSAAHRQATGQSLGVDADGDAIIAWIAQEGGTSVARIRHRAADGALSASQRLSPSGANVLAVKLAVSPAGDALAVWTRVLNGRIVVQGRSRADGGALGPVETLSYAGANANVPDVALGPDGSAAVVWLRDTPTESALSYTVQLRTISADGALSPTQALTPATYSAGEPRVAVTGDGSAVVGWTRNFGPVQYRVRAAGGALGAPVTLASMGRANSLTLAGNGTGRVAFAWAEPDGSGSVVRARIRQAGGGLGPAFDLGESGTSPRATAAVDPQGNATFAWLDPSGANAVVHARRRTPAGALGPVHVLSDPAGAAGSPHLAVDGGGKATVAWHWSPTGEHQARTITPGGAVSATRQVSGGAE